MFNRYISSSFKPLLPLVLSRGKATKATTISSKRGGRHFYKGKGSGPMGHWTKTGTYVVDPFKVRDYIVPDLKDFKLNPYVSPKAPKPPLDTPLTYQDFLASAPDGMQILEMVKEEQVKQVQMAIKKHAPIIYSKYDKFHGGERKWATSGRE